MKYILNFMILASALSFSACDRNDISRSSQVLARVGEKNITTTSFERQIGSLPESVQKLSSQGLGKKAVLESLVNKELLYAEALKKNVDKSADLLKKLDDQKKELIINTYLQNEVIGKIKIDDKEVENFYTANPAEFKNHEEVRISQIVAPDEAAAGEIIHKLELRRDFGELAQVHSTDKVSAVRKGDVGWFSSAKLPEDVRESVFKLPLGGVSKPYKRADGYEIYKITERRSVSYSLDQVHDTIKAQLFNEKLLNEMRILVDGLKKTTNVQINEALLR